MISFFRAVIARVEHRDYQPNTGEVKRFEKGPIQPPANTGLVGLGNDA
jgi:hypothetical protein